MKKILLIFIAAFGASYAHGQNINPETDHVQAGTHTAKSKDFKTDKALPQWCIDVNVTPGFLTQNLTSADIKSQYLNPLNSNISGLKFEKGYSVGFDAEIAYFFNANRNFGIGTGLYYMMQYGNVTMDNFYIEYQSTDKFGNTFRQLITANQSIAESLKISNFNIPLLLKYKNRFSKKVGFTADAGLLFNVTEKNSYTTNASFDYEAVYKYSGTQGGVTAVYDNGATYGASDVLLTKQQYLATHTSADIQNYFSTLRAQGNNVGLGVKPASNTGSVSYKSGSVGFLVRPAISVYLSDNVALNLGVYYLYQGFTNNSSTGMLTDKVGSYNSLISGISKSANSSYGINVGLRFYLGKAAAETVAPEVAPEEDKATETETPEPEEAPKKEVEIVEAPRKEPVNVSTPILFDLNKMEIKPEAYPILEEAVNEMNGSKNVQLIIHGYADITGKEDYNVKLSQRRALTVKKYLQNKGVNPKQLKTVGHGSKSPAASNRTPEGRARNRRVVMKIKKA